MSAPERHRTARILSVGDELVLGQALDTNTHWLSERLLARGVRPLAHATVPDELPVQARALAELATGCDLVVVTGGLGPTRDDLTRHALAMASDDELVEDDEALAFLERLERDRGRGLTPERRAQALRPSRGRSLANAHGTAPGLHAVVKGADVFCLPGPPREMRPMFDAHVAPALRADDAGRVFTRLLRTFGLPEADAGALLADLMDRDADPTVGTTASGGIVTIRLRAAGDDAVARLDRIETAVRERLGPAVFGGGEDTLPALAVRLLKERGERLAVAESCTGGLLGAAITGVPGASEVYDGGFLTYADEAKIAALGVDPEVISGHGAVSAACARAMARGVLASPLGVRTDHALAITGIAGPSGGGPGKPVGTVFIAHALRRPAAGDDARVHRFRIAGDRDDVRERSVVAALGILTLALRNERLGRPLLWEVT